MLHQIRDRIIIKLGEGKNTALYQKFKDRIDNILTTYTGNWTEMIKELEKLRQQMANPRASVVSKEKEPFYNMLCKYAGLDFDARHDNIIKITDAVIDEIISAMKIPHLWQKPTNVNELRGKIGTILRFSKISELKANSETIATELIKLARSNESILIKMSMNKQQ